MLFVLSAKDLEDTIKTICGINDIVIMSWDGENNSITFTINMNGIKECIDKTVGKKFKITDIRILKTKDPNFVCALEMDIKDPVYQQKEIIQTKEPEQNNIEDTENINERLKNDNDDVDSIDVNPDDYIPLPIATKKRGRPKNG